MIPKSDLYFTFCSNLNALSKKLQLMDQLLALENGMSPSTPLNGCELMYVFALPDI